MKVYYSGYLSSSDWGKSVYTELDKKLRGIMDKLPYVKNEFCRDYMPVQGADGQFVLFKYLPFYIGNMAFHERPYTSQMEFCSTLGIDCILADHIVMDGRSIEIFEDKGIITDRVIYNNYGPWNKMKPVVLQQIKQLLKLKELIVVPADPGNLSGHVDGLVRFIDRDTVLINDSDILDNIEMAESEKVKFHMWKNNFHASLRNAGLDIKTLPYAVARNKETDGSELKGLYLKFLLLDDKILMHSFDQATFSNIAAKEKLERLYKRPVIPFGAIHLAKEGGIINGVTWTCKSN
jgi:agmatine deiminase